MYYIVMEDTGQIVDEKIAMDEDIIQSFANLIGAAVFAIEGQHSGYSAEPSEPEAEPDALRGLPEEGH